MTTGDVGAPKIVWILGAGFSRGLGGPLIKNLLAPREEKVLRSLFPLPAHSIPISDILEAQAFYAWGKERGNWDDAEQFLDLVESAAAEPPPALSHANQLLTAMLTGTVVRPDPNPPSRYVTTSGAPTYYEFATLANLAQAARRALAVDCSLFLRSAQLDSERWAPYKRWAETLGSNHTVITFNYDQVPELLANLPASSLRVVPPTDSNTAFQRLRDSRKVPVLKVHGSVTWRVGEKGIVVADVMDPSIGDPSVAPVIGVPGPGKRRLVGNRLKELWELALETLRMATVVYFVGYRFPPTDADARSGLLGALGGGASIRTVLGPWVDEADSIRLRYLLNALSNGSVGAIPLLAEDFVGLWDKIRL